MIAGENDEAVAAREAKDRIAAATRLMGNRVVAAPEGDDIHGAATMARKTVMEANAMAEKKPTTAKAKKAAGNARVQAAASAAITNTPKTDPYDRPVAKNGMPLCMDGCGKPVAKVESRFIPGHDSTLKSLLLKVGRGTEAPEAVPTISIPYANEFLKAKGYKTIRPRATA